MEFKGTKGEWRIEKGNENNGRGKLSITTNENNICTIWAAVDDSETIPNAKLIAAAPENILEHQNCENLLKMILTTNQLQNGELKKELIMQIRISKKAIEKALK